MALHEHMWCTVVEAKEHAPYVAIITHVYCDERVQFRQNAVISVLTT